MKTRIICLLLIVAITSGACKKEKLTKETQIGANTFSCKINGKVYNVKNDLLSKGLTVVLFNGNAPNTYDLGIEAVMYNGDNSDYTISVDLFSIRIEGEFRFMNTNHRARLFNRHSNNYISTEGSMVITKFDLVNNIISGRFEFVAANEKDSNNKIIIKEGRFDLKY